MVRRKLSGVAAAALATLAMAAPASARDLPAIRKDGTLRVLVVPIEREPEFVDLGSKDRPGFDVEILQGFVRTQKVRLELVSLGGWDQLIPALLKEQGDLIAGRFTATDARRKQIEFTQPVFPTGVVVVTRKPRPVIDSVESLKAERTVGTIRGTSMDEALAAAGVPARAIDYAALQQKDLTSALQAGDITAAVWGLEGAIAAANHDPDLQIGMMLGAPASLAYGVRKEDTELRAALDAHLEVLRKTGAWQKLVVRYLGASAPKILKRAGQ
jgi:ABC-type amino acid transport substrate-binding protein